MCVYIRLAQKKKFRIFLVSPPNIVMSVVKCLCTKYQQNIIIFNAAAVKEKISNNSSFSRLNMLSQLFHFE